MEIEYIGEHLWPGRIGNFFIFLSFVSALLATLSYSFQVKSKDSDLSWRSIGRIAFRLHSFSVFGIIAVLFFLLTNHYFEYQYIWQHSSKEMPMKYILSCFWEGQEGSFLLWTFWHVVLGSILLRLEKNFEAPVMAVFSSVQVFLSSMLLGVYVFGAKVGCNPFILVRETTDNLGLPWTTFPDYITRFPNMFANGRGLNPLLQNYWMTIHPPTLFLGFAATLVPFAYAVAGLWTGKYKEWVKPALPWTFFGVMILGTGILMGGAWAYESLTFGGFWAWDPVENASLVPWLTLVGAAHLMLIQKTRNSSLITTFVFVFITFIFILYSTFLTRSGILGESSVHAFTDLGMNWQLLSFVAFYFIFFIVILVRHIGKMPKESGEESIMSREFWMFIGTLVLFISAFQIIFTTSIPVINKIFGTTLAHPANPIQHYNSWQLPFAVIVALLIAVGQFFKYKQTDAKVFFKKLSLSFVLSLLISVWWAYTLELFHFSLCLLLFSSLFAIISNADYLIRVLKGKLINAGSSVAHIGFAMVLLGALVSTGKSVIISQNTSGVDVESLGDSFKNNENIMLSKGDTLRMGAYFVTYKGQRKEGINVYYEVEYLTQKEGKYNHEFTLNPFLQLNERMGNVAEPDTRHFLTRDVYTHISYAEIDDPATDTDKDYDEPNVSEVSLGDTLFSSQSIMVLENISKNVNKEKYGLKDSDLAVSARLRITDVNNKIYYAEPVFAIRNNFLIPIAANVDEVGVKIIFDKIDPETGKVQIGIAEKKGNSKEFIVMKAIIFPFINVLWSGCIIMVIGTLMAIVYRIKRNVPKN